jgi:hypothetical protein
MNIALNIDRQMVGIFFEIKRSLPFEERDGMKIAAPGIGKQLISIYQESNSKNQKQLIEKFMHLAGNAWAKKLKTPLRSKLMLYRDQALENKKQPLQDLSMT